MSENKRQVTILGASGTVGKYILQLTLEKDYLVKVITRNKSKFDSHKNLYIIEGALNQETVDEVIQGSSVVFNCVGIGGLGNGKPNNIVSSTTLKSIAALEKHGVSRIICMSNIGIGDSKKYTPWYYTKVILPLFLRKLIPIMKDKEVMEDYLQNSILNWTSVRLPHISQGGSHGNFKESFRWVFYYCSRCC